MIELSSLEVVAFFLFSFLGIMARLYIKLGKREVGCQLMKMKMVS